MDSIWRWVAAFAIVLLASACELHAEPPVGYAELTYGDPYPGNPYVEGYPYTTYQGRVVYYYGDRWIYRDGGRWYGYRTEPPELYRYRTTIQQAPPAPRPGYMPGPYPQYPGPRPGLPYAPPPPPPQGPYNAPAPPGERVR